MTDKEWIETVEKIEVQLEGKAFYLKPTEDCMAFSYEPWKKNKDCPRELVQIKGYFISSLWKRILKYNARATQFSNVLKLESENGYYGFSHRGGCLFKIGDMIFNEDYVLDITKESNAQYVKETMKSMEEEGIEINNSNIKERIMGFVPFNKRGDKIIQTEKEALYSAHRLGLHLS